MQTASPLDDSSWAGILARLSAGIDIEATARATKAFVRARGVRNPADLLRLAFAYAVGGMSLRTTAAWAETVGLAQLSDVSLLDRLRNAKDWLEYLWQEKLARLAAPVPLPGLNLAVRLVDATTVSAPGSKGTDWRLHMDYRPLEGRFGAAVLTNGRKSEGFHHFAAGPGELVVGDRAYAKARGLNAIQQAGGHFLVRLGWNSLVLLDEQGDDFDLIGTLATLPAGKTTTFVVQVGSDAKARRPICTARLILTPLPEGAGDRARDKAVKKAKRQGRGVLAKGAIAAGWLMLLTSVGEDVATAEQMVALYRLRWQIELAFKRLKSLLGIDELTAKDPDLARSWLSAHLLTALLIDDDTCVSADSPPSAR